MLERLKDVVRRFRRDERGAFLVLFGVMALVLIATAGAVVDFTQIEQTRTRAQNALDAAALGLQPHVFDDPAWTEAQYIETAGRFLAERLGDEQISSSITSATFNARNGQLILNAEVSVPTPFVSLVGITTVKAKLLSEATRKRLNLEVAMVLDNSGSMGSYSRMSKLKEAAKSATDILFDDQATQPNVFISVVPFTQYVNVGTANRYASWMSQTGASSISHLNFDDDDDEDTPFTDTVNRWTLYDEFDNESWKGCVEARVAPFDTDDTVPNNAVPDTMFQPVFAPDGPPDNYISDTPTWCQKTRTCSWTETRYGCNSSGRNCWSGRDNDYEASYPDGHTESGSSACSCSGEDILSDTRDVDWVNGYYKYKRTRIRTCFDKYDPDLSDREKQERLCKYKGASFSGSGPNSDCPSTALLPLDNTRATIKDRIDDMVASGSTNIEQGTVWGFRSLSPTEPFTEGRPYDEATSKIMIIMTDGENNPNYQYYSSSNPYGNSSWTAWGFRSNKRLLTESTSPRDSTASSSQVIGEVNRRTELACANAKAKGIIVYTIGLSVPNSTTRTMLENCATPSKVDGGKTVKFSYFPSSSSDLVAVFKEIAEQLSELRLAQ